MSKELADQMQLLELIERIMPRAKFNINLLFKSHSELWEMLYDVEQTICLGVLLFMFDNVDMVLEHSGTIVLMMGSHGKFPDSYGHNTHVHELFDYTGLYE